MITTNHIMDRRLGGGVVVALCHDVMVPHHAQGDIFNTDCPKCWTVAAQDEERNNRPESFYEGPEY